MKDDFRYSKLHGEAIVLWSDSVECTLKEGGTKHDEGKPPISYIPRPALEAEAMALAYGSGKYGRHNFKRGFNYSRLIDAALRHILAFNEGEEIDSESGVSHLGHARACLAFLLDQQARGTGKDDRFKG